MSKLLKMYEEENGGRIKGNLVNAERNFKITRDKGSFVSGGSVAIKVNDDVRHYFQTKKGLRQGDSLSPMLFNN